MLPEIILLIGMRFLSNKYLAIGFKSSQENGHEE